MSILYVTNLTGDEYAAQLTTTNDLELNGNQFLSGTIYASKVNDLFINDISEMWKVTDHDDVEHKIIYARRQGVGDKMKVDIKATPVFFHTLNNDRIYERYDEHMTAQLAFARIFEDTGFTFVLGGSFSAVQWEGFGDGETKLESFKRALERYKCEFRIVGNIVYLEHQIGNDTQHMYRHKLNASNIVQEIDANDMWTYAKGFGDYGDGEGGEDWQNAKLKREYTSPLANIIGKQHAPPIKNGKITDKDTMDEQLKILVEESLKISISADIHDLTRQNYPIGQSQVGDRVFVIDERIGLNKEVRVVNKSITRDWLGKITDVNLTFGSDGIAKRHQSNISTAVKDITALLEGKKTLPFSVLDEAVRNATELLQTALTELQVPSNGGLLAVDPDDPNYLVAFTSKGIGVSSDGGATFPNAITGLGVNADYVYTGSMLANRIAGGMLTSLNGRVMFDLNNGKLVIEEGSISIKRPDGAYFIQDGIPNLNYNVQGSSPTFTSGSIDVVGQWYRTSSTESNVCDMYSFRHEGRYLRVTVAHAMAPEGSSSGAVSLRGLNDWADKINATKTFSNVQGDGNAYHTFTIDIGTPTYQAVDFYIELRTGSTIRYASCRILRAWQEG